MLLSVASLLTACAGSTGFADKGLSVGPQLERPDPTLTADCPTPTLLPEGRLKQATLERLWSKDRAGLKDCGKRHKATVEFYTNRDEALGRRP